MHINIDLSDKTYGVRTYDGYYISDDIYIDKFGIQIGEDFSIQIKSKTAIQLIKELSEHLENCGFNLNKNKKHIAEQFELKI